MKVVHLVSGDMSQGAARGAYWLHKAQRALGIDSTIISNCQSNCGDETVVSLANTPLQKLKYLSLPRLAALPVQLYGKRKPYPFNTGFEGGGYQKQKAYQEADIIHLHWINGLVSIRSLRAIHKPIVWTLRDLWPMTGGCHFSLGCDQYTAGCGKCPILGSNHTWDLSRLILHNKRSSIPKHLQVVGISQWISQCARNSQLFSGHAVQTISNNIDTEQFFPIDKTTARKILRLPGARRIVMVGAQDLSYFYKGTDTLLEALASLREENLHLLLVGKVDRATLDELCLDYTSLGFLSDSVSLRLAYSAADVFLMASRMEAFGKMAAESMACGTPVVCFNATGLMDIVEHEKNGYAAPPFGSAALADGVSWILDRPDQEYQQLCSHALSKVQTTFDSKVVAQQYQALYQQLLNN